jgi:hypothetical protein
MPASPSPYCNFEDENRLSPAASSASPLSTNLPNYLDISAKGFPTDLFHIALDCSSKQSGTTGALVNIGRDPNEVDADLAALSSNNNPSVSLQHTAHSIRSRNTHSASDCSASGSHAFQT